MKKLDTFLNEGLIGRMAGDRRSSGDYMIDVALGGKVCELLGDGWEDIYKDVYRDSSDPENPLYVCMDSSARYIPSITINDFKRSQLRALPDENIIICGSRPDEYIDVPRVEIAGSFTKDYTRKINNLLQRSLIQSLTLRSPQLISGMDLTLGCSPKLSKILNIFIEGAQGPKFSLLNAKDITLTIRDPHKSMSMVQVICNGAQEGIRILDPDRSLDDIVIMYNLYDSGLWEEVRSAFETEDIDDLKKNIRSLRLPMLPENRALYATSDDNNLRVFSKQAREYFIFSLSRATGDLVISRSDSPAELYIPNVLL